MSKSRYWYFVVNFRYIENSPIKRYATRKFFYGHALPSALTNWRLFVPTWKYSSPPLSGILLTLALRGLEEPAHASRGLDSGRKPLWMDGRTDGRTDGGTNTIALRGLEEPAHASCGLEEPFFQLCCCVSFWFWG